MSNDSQAASAVIAGLCIAFVIGITVGILYAQKSLDVSVEEYERIFDIGYKRAQEIMFWTMSDDNFAIDDIYNYSEVAQGLKFLWYRYNTLGELWDYELVNDYIKLWRVM